MKFNKWKTLLGLARSFSISLDDMNQFKKYEGFPKGWCGKDGVRYNYYVFKDWLAKYKAGEVKRLPPPIRTPEEQKYIDEANTGKYFMDGKWIDMDPDFRKSQTKHDLKKRVKKGSVK